MFQCHLSNQKSHRDGAGININPYFRTTDIFVICHHSLKMKLNGYFHAHASLHMGTCPGTNRIKGGTIGIKMSAVGSQAMTLGFSL
jgi:hypothetical protein